MMKRSLKILFFFFILYTGLINQVAGQGNYPISLQVNITPPYSAYISDYKRQLILTITNHYQNDMDVYLSGRMESDRGYYIRTAPNIYSRVPIHVPALQTVVVSGYQLDTSFLDLNNLQSNLDPETFNSLKQFGMIPEGFYSYCITAYTRNANNNYIQASDPTGSCAYINIGYVSPPRILNPLPDDKILPSPNQNVNISWTRPVGNMQGASLVYDLYLVKVLPGQDPNVSLSNAVQYGAGLFLKRSNIPINNFQFTNLTTFHLDQGSRYALMVQAKDLTGKTAFENNGRSEVQVFQYGVPPKNNIAIAEKTPLVKEGNCSCAVDVASLDKTNNNASLKAGGSFTMATLPVKIGSLNNNGATVSGDGTILINNVPIQITFKDIVVNKNGVTVAGTATAKTAGGFDFLDNGGVPSVSTADYNTFMNRIKNYNLDAIKNGVGITLPFGLNSVGAPDAVNVGVVDLHVTPVQATYNAIAVVQLADANNVLSLLAKDVCFSDASPMCGDALFVLAEDFNVPGIHLNFKSYQSESEPGTYVLYTNKELKKFHINAEYTFPNSLITKADGSPEKAVLNADAGSWSDWTASVTMEPFVLPALKTMVFSLTENAYYDHSTLRNPAGMPASFSDAALVEKNPVIGNALWTGFFIPSITAALPSIVKNVNRPDHKLEIGATNLVLDKDGLTGVVGAKKIVSLEDGSIGGWYCSVDEISIKLLNSSYKTGGLYGQVILPFSNKDNVKSRVNYSCTLSSTGNGGDLKYQFIATKKDVLDFSAWWARLNLDNCSIVVTNNTATGNTVASAAISGKLSLEGNIQGYKVGLDLIKVEHLVVQTEQPYVRVGNVTAGFSSPQHFLSGFPVSIKNIHPKMNGSSAGLQFDVGLTLSDVPNKILPDATSTLTVSANILSGDRPVWQRTDIALDSVIISGDLAGIVHIEEGRLDFMKDDPQYGDGIRGHIKASFAGLPGALVECNTMFGNRSSMNYWYFDAYGTLPDPKPVIGPGISLNGIGGGYYYNLSPKVQINMNAEDYFSHRDKYKLDQYVPQSGSFGMKLMVGISSTDGALFNGIGTLETTFNTAGGFSLQSLKGDAFIELFKKPESDKLSVDKEAPVQAHVGWMIGIADKVFAINAQVQINYLDMIKGGGAFALLADATNENYYIKIGEPLPLPGKDSYGNRIHLSMQDPLHILNLQLKAYFMAGNQIDASLPDPDPTIVNISKLKGYQKLNLGYSKGGIVFGASASFEYDLRFMIFYFNAKAGIGFDLSLLTNLTCGDGGKPSGMNGWYASGQIYAGLEGAFGLYVDMFFCHDCQLEALKLRADVLIQAGLPDPTWIKGYASTHYAVLNGLIEGNVNFKIAIGKECKVNQSVFALPLIQEVKPFNGSSNVPLNAYPEILFNYPVEKGFELVMPESGMPKTFKIQIDELTVTNEENGNIYADYRYAGSYPSFDDNHRKLTLMPEAAFLPQSRYSIHIKVKAMTNKMRYGPIAGVTATNDWVPVIEKGQEVTGDSSSLFKTGYCKLDELVSDPRTRLGAFPFPGQRYFLQGESKKGAIILDRDYVCADNPKEEYQLLAKFTPVKDHQELKSYEMPITEGAGHYLYFNIPALPNDCIIRVDIIKRTNFSKFDKYQLCQGSSSLATQLTRTAYEAGSNTVEVSNQYYKSYSAYNMVSENSSAEKYMGKVSLHQKLTLGDKDLDVVLYAYHFRTSRYNTLEAKMAAARFDKVLGYLLGNPVSQINVVERFDTYDINGFSSAPYNTSDVMYFTMPLVTLKETNDYNSWLKNVAVPLVYRPFRKANIALDQARIEQGLTYKALQLEGIGCNYGNDVYCVPQRPVTLDGFDPPLTAEEIKAAEPVRVHGINMSGFKIVKSALTSSPVQQVNLK